MFKVRVDSTPVQQGNPTRARRIPRYHEQWRPLVATSWQKRHPPPPSPLFLVWERTLWTMRRKVASPWKDYDPGSQSRIFFFHESQTSSLSLTSCVFYLAGFYSVETVTPGGAGGFSVNHHPQHQVNQQDADGEVEHGATRVMGGSGASGRTLQQQQQQQQQSTSVRPERRNIQWNNGGSSSSLWGNGWNGAEADEVIELVDFDPGLHDDLEIVVFQHAHLVGETPSRGRLGEEDDEEPLDDVERVTDEGPLALAMQAIPSLLLAACGLFLAGWLFDFVQVCVGRAGFLFFSFLLNISFFLSFCSTLSYSLEFRRCSFSCLCSWD